MSLLPKDTTLHFPQVFVIPASAGSGKTYTLAHRYVQFLLSSSIQENHLRNILAVTFTKLAAKEMKERIVLLLKEAALNDPKTIERLEGIVSLSHEEITFRSQQLIEEILHNYSDFSVRTIDSFLTTVFKASSLELGVQPDVEIEFDNDAVIDQAFRQFSQRMREGSSDANFIDELVALIEANESSAKGYLWNPFTKIVREVRQLQSQFAKHSHDPLAFDVSSELQELKKRIIERASGLSALLQELQLPTNSYFKKDVDRLASGDVFAIAKKEKWSKYFNKFNDKEAALYERRKKEIFSLVNTLERNLEKYIFLYSQNYYQPFVRAVSLVDETMKEVKQLEGTVAMDDINRSLAKYLSNDVVPEVYFKLGERIAHFMIDEFQDTSPVQWRNFLPLIEEALSKNGSLFAVGDTKQSIYGFRGADWHIFKNLADQKYFPSAPAEVIPLLMNFRSAEVIVSFVKETFTSKIQTANLQEHAEASGLYNFAQEVPTEQQGKGYVEVRLLEKSDDDRETTQQQHDYILATINDCLLRGYSYGDIAVLTPNNADVVEISSWLNTATVPFLSLSTLDIRKRKIIGEIIALLRFLDSPIVNLAFATFVLGDLFQEVLSNKKNNSESLSFGRMAESRNADPSIRWDDNTQEFANREVFRKIFSPNQKEFFYRTFEKQFPSIWNKYFDRLFALVGYMPLYDIVSEVYKTFSVFECCPLEESSLIKLLECVKTFENSGNNSLKDFLSFSGEEGGDQWSIAIPAGINAVRIMTVHKAKGLGFPVVIVFLKEKRSMVDSRVMIESEKGLSLFRVTKETSARSKHLAMLFKEREKEQIIDELNKLYVALTRAQQEMYVMTTFREKENLPTVLLPEQTLGTKYHHMHASTPVESTDCILPVYKNTHAMLKTAQYEKIGIQETHRGDLVHALLSNIEFTMANVVSDVEQAALKLSIPSDFDIEKEKANLVQFLSLPEIAQHFQSISNRIIYREKDITASSGRLFRMDRVIIDDSVVTVVDFKTGSDEMNDEYQEQVKNYMTMLGELYPAKTICGALLYVDMRKAVPVV